MFLTTRGDTADSLREGDLRKQWRSVSVPLVSGSNQDMSSQPCDLQRLSRSRWQPHPPKQLCQPGGFAGQDPRVSTCKTQRFISFTSPCSVETSMGHWTDSTPADSMATSTIGGPRASTSMSHPLGRSRTTVIVPLSSKGTRALCLQAQSRTYLLCSTRGTQNAEKCHYGQHCEELLPNGRERKREERKDTPANVSPRQNLVNLTVFPPP